MGQVLAEIGRHTQVICITHRAEIAGQATTHLQVVKHTGPSSTSATIALVDGQPRVQEMARLLSGAPTPAATARAQELLAGNAI
jgi:DNA repair protein RecN (Recombination protein N)